MFDPKTRVLPTTIESCRSLKAAVLSSVDPSRAERHGLVVRSTTPAAENLAGLGVREIDAGHVLFVVALDRVAPAHFAAGLGRRGQPGREAPGGRADGATGR